MGRPEEIMGLLSNQELTRKELERETKLSNVSPYVAALINSGCVEEVEEGDRRFNLKLRLTDKGRKTLSKTMATMTIKGRILSLCNTHGGTIKVPELCKEMSLSQTSLFLELDELEENRRITRREVGGIDYIRLSELGEIQICSTLECINVALPNSSYCKLCHTPAEGSISLRIPPEPEEPEPEEPEGEKPPEEPEPEEPEPEIEKPTQPPSGGEESYPSLLQAIKHIQKLKEDIANGQRQRDSVCKVLDGLQADINKLTSDYQKETIVLEERIKKLEERIEELGETSTVTDVSWYKKMIELALEKGGGNG